MATSWQWLLFKNPLSPVRSLRTRILRVVLFARLLFRCAYRFFHFCFRKTLVFRFGCFDALSFFNHVGCVLGLGFRIVHNCGRGFNLRFAVFLDCRIH